MPGGLLQLASCADNKLLIDNLNFSHFKLVYKTSHPFSFQDLNIKFKGQNKFGSKNNLKIPSYGDLLQNLMMYCELPSLEAKYNNDIPTELKLNTDKNIYSCKYCNNNTDIAQVRMPYAFKLLNQELYTMNIMMRYICN